MSGRRKRSALLLVTGLVAAMGLLAVGVGGAVQAQAAPPPQSGGGLGVVEDGGPPLRTPPYQRGAYVPGEVLVKFNSGAPAYQVNGLAQSQGSTVLSEVPSLDIKRMAVPGDVEAAVEAYEASPWVEYAQPNYLYWPSIVPDDPWYDDGHLISGFASNMDFQRWYLGPTTTSGGWEGIPLTYHYRLNAEAAWDLTTGNASVVIAVVDSGVDLDHPDLAVNIWTNPGEVPGNGIDDDGNGYIDDVNGWDFFSDDNDPNPDLGDGIDNDGNGGADDTAPHGTMVAGAAAAIGNDAMSIAGAAWNATIMPLKVFTDDGGAPQSGILEAILYATDDGADIINLSLGSLHTNACPVVAPAYEDAVNYAFNNGVVVVAAAGNENSANPSTPASCTNALSVGASDHDSVYWHNFPDPRDWDGRASFTNYGQYVDVVAPGASLMTTYVATQADEDGGGDPAGTPLIWAGANGTSFSAPLVSGLAALILSRAEDLGIPLMPWEVRSLIQSTATDLPDDPDDNPDAGADWDGNGMVNFAAAVQGVAAFPTPTPTPIPTPTATLAPTATPTPVPVPAVGNGPGLWTLAVILAVLVGFGALRMSATAQPQGGAGRRP